MCVCTTIRCWKSVKAFKLLIVNRDSYFQFPVCFNFNVLSLRA